MPVQPRYWSTKMRMCQYLKNGLPVVEHFSGQSRALVCVADALIASQAHR